MCSNGDIILIDGFVHKNKHIGQHSFVIINDESGKIKGLEYDMIGNVMSSFKDEEHRDKKLNYPTNFRVKFDDVDVKNANYKEGYIKADQLYFFNRKSIDYTLIGKLKPDAFNSLIDLVNQIKPSVFITDNL